MVHAAAPAPFLAVIVLPSSRCTEALQIPGASQAPLPWRCEELSCQGLRQGYSSVAHGRTGTSPGDRLWEAGPGSPHHAMTHLQHPAGEIGPGCSQKPPFLAGSSESKCRLQSQSRAPQAGKARGLEGREIPHLESKSGPTEGGSSQGAGGPLVQSRQV